MLSERGSFRSDDFEFSNTKPYSVHEMEVLMAVLQEKKPTWVRVEQRKPTSLSIRAELIGKKDEILKFLETGGFDKEYKRKALAEKASIRKNWKDVYWFWEKLLWFVLGIIATVITIFLNTLISKGQ